MLKARTLEQVAHLSCAKIELLEEEQLTSLLKEAIENYHQAKKLCKRLGNGLDRKRRAREESKARASQPSSFFLFVFEEEGTL